MAKILFATTAAGVKFYPVTITDAVVHIKGNTQTKLSELLDAIDYSGKADKVSGATNGNFAGLDSNGNLTDSGKKAADFEAAGSIATAIAALDATESQTAGADGLALSITETDGVITAISGSIAANTYDAYGAAADVLGDSEDTATDNTVYGAKAYADSLASNYDAAGTAAAAIEALDASVSQAASTDGLALSLTEVDGVVTAISGSIAAETYDDFGAAAAVLGTSSDAASANTVYGAKAYADSLVVGGVIYKGTVDGTTKVLPTEGYKQGWEYAVTVAGTYAGKACDAGDFLIANKDYAAGATASADWDIKQGTVAVTDAGASLVIGTATQIATVEGVNINVTQVEDMTKIEAVAVADTTEYADVTSLFTAPSAGE